MSQPQPHARLSRDEAAAALRAAGFTITSATLATRAARRTGPPIEMFSGRPVYEWQSTLDWAQADAARKASTRRRAALNTEAAALLAPRPPVNFDARNLEVTDRAPVRKRVAPPWSES